MRRLRSVGPLLGVVAVQAVLARGLLGGAFPTFRDLSRLFIPLKWYVSQSLRDGRLPQWWPWDGLGMPLASQPMASLFHPSTALYALLPFQPAFALQWWLPLPVGAWGTFRLARALGLRPWAAALSGAAFSLSGYSLSLTEFTFSSLSASALPFVALGALRLSRRRPRLGGLSVALALVLLGGDPVLVALALGTALVLSLHGRAWWPPAWLVVALVLGLMVAAVQWGPTAALYLESSRSRGTVHGSTFWAMGPAQLLELVVPPAPDRAPFLFRSTYLGIVTCALAVVGAAARGRRRVGLLATAALSMGLALGDAAPLWGLASALVPGWGAFRFPAKAIAPFVLVVAVLAGRGAQLVWCRWRRRPWLAALLLVTVVAQLSWANGSLLATEPLPARVPVFESLQRLGVSREGSSYAWRWQLPPGAPESTWAQVSAGAPAAGARFGLPTSNAYVPGFSAEYGALTERSMWTWLGPLAGVFGSRFLVVSPDGAEGPALERDAASGAVIEELTPALPRAYLASGVVRVRRDLVPVALRQGRFRPGDDVVLAEDEGGPPARAPVEPMRPASVRVVDEDVEVTTTASVPSVLVLNEALFDGVRASEGDRELSVLRVNHAVRGVELEPGPHTVRFRFRTPGLWPAAAVSAVGVGLLGLLWRRRRLRWLRW